MKTNIVYRNAELSDSLNLSVLFKQVFIQTYATEGINTESSIYITKEFSVEKIKNTIENYPGNIIVALNGNNLVGVAEIDFEKECPVNNELIPELSKLYVLECFMKKGIGYRLLTEVEKAVRIKGEKELWLSVNIMNTRAISFYERQQYKRIGNLFFQMEFNSYENHVMLKKL